MMKQMIMTKSFRPLCSALLFALAVAMLAVTPIAPASGMMTLSICGADGITRAISVPTDPEQRYPDDCVKGCHGFCSRKQSPEDDDEPDD